MSIIGDIINHIQTHGTAMRYPEFHYRWKWLLNSSPEQLWPLVADTNRFNRDAGLPEVHLSADSPQRNARRRLWFSMLGINVAWEEEPFEWVRPQRFGVVRRYLSGPIAVLRGLVELAPLEKGSTQLTYCAWVRPRNLLGLAVVPLVMAMNRRRFSSVLPRYDLEAQRKSYPPAQPSRVRLAPGGSERLTAMKQRLADQTGERVLAARLCDTVENADSLSLGRLRPYMLADAWGEPRRKILDLCLHGTRAGLFDLQWDLLCPLCRGAKASSTTLRDVKDRVHCETCNIDFAANFERSVELTFKPNPSIRPVKAQDFCVAGPEMTPHVVAQQLLAPAARCTLTLPLEPGRYRLRTLAMAGGRFLVASSEGAREVSLTATASGWPSDELAILLMPTLHFVNETQDEHLFILERMAWTDPAVTAAEVTSRQVFRDLFSNEVLRPGQQISVGTLSILFTDLKDSTRLYRDIGDAPAFGRVLDHFEILRKAIVTEDGTVVKTIGDAIMAVFPRPVAALRSVLKAQDELATCGTGEMPLVLKAGIHQGHCIAVTLNDRLDYFGSTVNLAARLERYSSGEDVIISETVRSDPEVALFLSKPGGRLEAERFGTRVSGFEEQRFPLWRVRRGKPGRVECGAPRQATQP
jgi:class 3 adenylate cyclase